METKENKRFFLSYVIPTKEGNLLVKLATDNGLKEREQCKINIALALNNMSVP